MAAYRVRHEAGEALGAIGTPECLQLLERYQTDPCLEVAQTCQLALQRIQYYDRLQSSASSASEQQSTLGTAAAGSSSSSGPRSVVEGTHDSTSAAEESASPYLSVDPAPAAPASTPTAQLRATLLDERAPIFERYRALFALRNKVLAPPPWPAPSRGSQRCSGSVLVRWVLDSQTMCQRLAAAFQRAGLDTGYHRDCLRCPGQGTNGMLRSVSLCLMGDLPDLPSALPGHHDRLGGFLTGISALRLAHAARAESLCRVEQKPSRRWTIACRATARC